MTPMAAALLGLLTGLHAASWGAYKDVPFEGFRGRSYLRSVLVGALAAVALVLVTPLDTVESAVVLLGVFYTAERLCTEWWKTILRVDDQTTYTIPMRLGYRGSPVDNRLIRYGTGAAVVLTLLGATWVGVAAQPALGTLPSWAFVLLAGTGGWLTAAGGAWKDAPVEGFSGWKFLRSPAVATAWACPLSMFTDDWVVLTVSTGGFAVASIETYKTFLTGGRPPGKFSSKPVRFGLPGVRRLLAVVHASAWGALAVALCVRPPGQPEGMLASALVAAVAALAATLVLRAGLGRGSPGRPVTGRVRARPRPPEPSAASHRR